MSQAQVSTNQFPGPRCGELIGDGMVEYPCWLPQSHSGPHAALEASGSMQRRRAWEDAQQAEALRHAQEAPPPLPVPQQAPQSPQQAPVAPDARRDPLLTQEPSAPPLVFGGGESVPTRLGDDVRMIVSRLHTILVAARDTKKLPGQDITWAVQATEALRDVFDPRSRDSG